MLESTKEPKLLQKNENTRNDEWHFSYANKTVESWPAWKKEIYGKNFASLSVDKHTCKR